MTGATTFEYSEKPVYEQVTRAINVTVALLGLIILAPLMLGIALAIKVSDPSAPVLYRGRRIGKGGKPYAILKFRTMVPGTEQLVGARLIEQDSPYITPLGRLLRRRKLDELPQLLNVLRGEMNLVGPRPAREVFLDELRQRISGYDRRFLVKPGITGLAQVNGGYYTDPHHKLRYELLYLSRRSVWLDLKLIAATLLIMASRTLTMFGLLFFLLAFVIFVPTTFLPTLHVDLLGFRISVAFLLIACLASAWLARRLLRRGLTLRRTPADKYIVGFVLWAILGALLNPAVPQNLLGVLYLCSGAFVLYFLATQTIERSVTRIRRYMQFLGLITIAVSLWGVLEYVTGRGVSDGGFRVVSTLGDPNVSALYLAIALPVLLYLCLTSRRRLTHLTWRGGALLAGTCVALTFSRSGYLAFAIALLVFLARWHRRLFYGVLAGCGVLLLAAEFGGSARFSLRQMATSPPTQHMLQLYAAALSGSRDELLLGVGWRNWRTAVDGSPTIQDDMPLGPISRPRTLKNMYLTFLTDHGLVGLFFMLLIFVTALKAIYDGSQQIPERSLQILLWAIFSSGLGFMANMLFFDAFYFIAIQATFWSLLGFGMGIALEFGSAARPWYRVWHFQH
jgi:lipopolysaccharide/colanic/teichoic acid biosynthesis glycosyltransferase